MTHVAVQIYLHQAENGPAEVHHHAVPYVAREGVRTFLDGDLARFVDDHGELLFVLVVVAHLVVLRVPGSYDGNLGV